LIEAARKHLSQAFIAINTLGLGGGKIGADVAKFFSAAESALNAKLLNKKIE